MFIPVKEILETVGMLSFSRPSSTEIEKKFYLRYLNMAYHDLWQIACNISRLQTMQEVICEVDKYGEKSTNLPEGLFIKRIICGKVHLSPTNIDYLFNVPEGKYLVSGDRIFISHRQVLSKNPLGEEFLFIIGVPTPKELVLEDALIDSTLQTSAFQIMFRNALIAGTLRYVYLANGGFTSRITAQEKKWEDAKKSLSNYYGNQ